MVDVQDEILVELFDYKHIVSSATVGHNFILKCVICPYFSCVITVCATRMCLSIGRPHIMPLLA